MTFQPGENRNDVCSTDDGALVARGINPRPIRRRNELKEEEQPEQFCQIQQPGPLSDVDGVVGEKEGAPSIHQLTLHLRLVRIVLKLDLLLTG